MITLRTFAASLAVSLALAAEAQAGELSFGFGKHGKHGSFGVSISNHGVGVSVGPALAACPPYQAPRQVWVPGRYEIVHEQVWIDGCREKVWIAPSQRVVCDAYGRTRTVFEPGRWEIVETPGRYETRAVQVWRPGHYQPHGVVGYGGYGGHGGYGSNKGYGGSGHRGRGRHGD